MVKWGFKPGGDHHILAYQKYHDLYIRVMGRPNIEREVAILYREDLYTDNAI